jgi:hypothetical protein
MLKDTVFSFAHASAEQALAFIVFGMFTIGFFIWVAYLVRMRH